MHLIKSKWYLSFNCVVYPDSYSIGSTAFLIEKGSMLPWRRDNISIPKKEIDEYRCSQGFWGWIFNYGTVSIKSDGKWYKLTGLKDFKVLRDSLNDFIEL